MRFPFVPVTATVLAVGLAGCGDDAFSPTIDSVAGDYSTSAFTVTTPIGTVDLLALGGQVDVTLNPDGTTSGQLLAPVGGEGGGDLEADLDGTWTLSGETVTFDMASDTFVRDVAFTATRNRLTGEGTLREATVRLVLTQSAQSRIAP